jgi:hypothetical protein
VGFECSYRTRAADPKRKRGEVGGERNIMETQYNEKCAHIYSCHAHRTGNRDARCRILAMLNVVMEGGSDVGRVGGKDAQI